MKFELIKQLGRLKPGTYDWPESVCKNLTSRGFGKQSKAKPETKEQKFEPETKELTRSEMIQVLRDKGETVPGNISNAKLKEKFDA